MAHFCSDFKIKKSFGVSLEYERDPLTNKSEVETPEEIANKMGCSNAKYIREAVLAFNAKNEHMISRNPKLDQFVGESKPEDYIAMEPTLADYLDKHKEHIKKSNFSPEECRRRERNALSISKLYYNEGQYQEEKEYEESRQLTLKREKELKNEELGVG
jgi:hypothetical protein